MTDLTHKRNDPFKDDSSEEEEESMQELNCDADTARFSPIIGSTSENDYADKERFSPIGIQQRGTSENEESDNDAAVDTGTIGLLEDTLSVINSKLQCMSHDSRTYCVEMPSIHAVVESARQTHWHEIVDKIEVLNVLGKVKDDVMFGVIVHYAKSRFQECK